MTQLSKVVSSILRDMVFAQHQANMYAIGLAKPYKKSGNADNFPLPCVALGEMDLEIKYGVVDESSFVERSEIDYPKLDKYIIKLSKELSQVIVSTMVSTVLSSIADGKDGNNDLIKKLDQEGELKHKFLAFLSHKLQFEFQKETDSLLDDNGEFISEIISSIAFKVGSDVVLHNEDLNSYFDLDNGENLRQVARDSLNATLGTIIPNLIDGVNLMKTESYQSLDVAISSEELSKYSKESIHSFRFKIVPRDIRINSDDDEFYKKR